MAIITLVFALCIINCAPAFHGQEVDQLTSTGEAVKESATQLEAKAINIDFTMDSALTLCRPGADHITPTRKYDKDIATHINAKAIKEGAATAYNGLKVDQVSFADTPTRLQKKVTKEGTDINGHESPANGEYKKSTRKAMYVIVTRSLSSEVECHKEPCGDEVDPDGFCNLLPGCYGCREKAPHVCQYDFE